MTERYAIYFSTKKGDSLDLAGSSWLGRDARSGALTGLPVVPGIEQDRFHELTEAARHYGFHGTLKAPFELAEGYTGHDVVQAVEAWSVSRVPFDLSLKVGTIADFLALVPVSGVEPLADLAFACVTDFDRFRAPLTEADMKRRQPEKLTDRQREYLERWGYPYVDREFRFHMTLSAQVYGDEKAVVLAAAENHFAEVLSYPIRVASVAVFSQENRQAPFRHIADCHFSGK